MGVITVDVINEQYRRLDQCQRTICVMSLCIQESPGHSSAGPRHNIQSRTCAAARRNDESPVRPYGIQFFLPFFCATFGDFYFRAHKALIRPSQDPPMLPPTVWCVGYRQLSREFGASGGHWLHSTASLFQLGCRFGLTPSHIEQPGCRQHADTIFLSMPP